MRILLADKLSPFVAGRLQDLGAGVDAEPALAGDALTRRLAERDPEVLVVRSTKVTAADVEASPSLALVIRAGAGFNNIDLSACSNRGIYVANCPGMNAAAVAELAMGHLINLDRRISDNVAALRARRWNKKEFGVAQGLEGRRLAILGCGTIGMAVARRALAFGMRVVGWSRSLTPQAAQALGIEHAATPEEAARDADAVSVHLALSAETRGRIGESVFSAMRPGAYFVNTSRGEVVDQQALRRALTARGLRAGLDVFEKEPSAGQGPFEDDIADEPGVYGTHHIGASTQQAEDAVGEEVVRIVTAYREGMPIPSCVNLSLASEATHRLVVRHADRVGVLAHVLGALREAGLNVQEMQNIVFSGSEAACARIGIVGEPTPETLRSIAAHPDVFAVSATAVAAV